MNRIEKALFVIAFAGLSCSVQAITPENRYETIIDRNIFRLNPMPVVVAPTNADPVLEHKIKFSGISNVGGHKKAWFVVEPKTGSKDLPLYLNLSEGERQDFLEVISIMDDESKVKVNNAGNPMVLSLKDDSLKPQPVSAMPSAPPVAHVATPAALPPPANSSYGNNSYGNRGGPVTVSGGPSIGSQPGSAQTAGSTGLRSIPTRTLRLAPVANNETAPVNPLEQRVRMELQQEQARQSGQTLPPLPPLPQ